MIPVDTRRCWDLPPQPGPEVRVVEDRRGWRWERQDFPQLVRWQLTNPPPRAGRYVVYWRDLFEDAPLVDATNQP